MSSSRSPLYEIKALLEIVPHPLATFESNDPLVHTARQKIREAISPSLQRELEEGSIEGLLKELPLLKASPPSSSPWITLICPSEYTHGVGRYFADALCRWLVPGKNLSIIANSSLCFSFESFPQHGMYLSHVRVLIEREEDIEVAAKNFPSLLKEIRLNVTAVYRARHIASLRSVSFDQKKHLIQENLRTILTLPSQERERSLFDQMHDFLLKISGEEKMGQIQQTLTRLYQKRPKSFDRSLFYEMTHFTLLFKEQFTSRRDFRHVSRVIAIFYLFKKVLLQAALRAPHEKHFSIRFFTTRLGETEPVLCILLGMTIPKELKRVNNRFLMEAIHTLLPEAKPVKDSYLVDRREEKIAFFYLEIAKPSHQPFSIEEIKHLREKFELEVRKKLELDVHPIFLPRNEEDFARNLLLLSQQIKTGKDLPQASIHFDYQTDAELLFSVFLVRLLPPGALELRELLFQAPRPFKMAVEEMRKVGMLRHKTPKEGAVLKVTLEKTPFFRGDFSVDLLKARQKIADELHRILGLYRDFNGGMILKQEEALRELLTQTHDIPAEAKYLLEDYFYSIRPGVMQTLLPPSILQRHFSMLLQLQQRSSQEVLPFLEDQIDGFSLFFTEVPDSSFKERVDAGITLLGLPSYELASCFVQLPSLVAAGYLLKTEESGQVDAFRAILNEQ